MLLKQEKMKRIIYILGLLAVTLSACENWFDVQPKEELSSDGKRVPDSIKRYLHDAVEGGFVRAGVVVGISGRGRAVLQQVEDAAEVSGRE